MRSDINILWIEDSPKWQEKAERLFRLKVEDYGLLTYINYISEGIPSLYEQIKTEAEGYKVYDIIFVDYNISGDEIENEESQKITGDKLIEEFRKYDIDADILFYSQNLKESTDVNKDEKKQLILKSSAAFDGIYLANRKDFQEHALRLYKKNIRKLTSMLNIRGLLMDKTSENDYVMKSYLLEKFDRLEDSVKNELEKKIISMISKQIQKVRDETDDAEKILMGKSYKYKHLHDLPSYIFSITDRYELFSEMLILEKNKIFEKQSINEYQNKIIKTRNTVAHKKIDICRQKKFLKYYDTLKQYNDRICPANCEAHTDDNKISLEKWKETLKLANEYSKLFDEVLSELENEYEKCPTKNKNLPSL